MKTKVFVDWIGTCTWKIRVEVTNYSKRIPYIATSVTFYYAWPYHDEKTIINFKKGSKRAERKLLSFAKTCYSSKCILHTTKTYFDKKKQIYRVKEFIKESWLYQ